jgi:hypothetical protein
MTRRFRFDLRINDLLVLSNATVDLEEVGPAPQNASGQAAKTDNGPKITDNQRRFLFRLLAGQRIDGNQAEAHLRDYFKVKGLGDIPKEAASTYIDQLVRDQKEGGT